MKVTGYVYIVEHGFYNVHNIGVLIEKESTPFAIYKSHKLPGLGQDITEYSKWQLLRQDKYNSLSKLAKYLYGIE